MQFEQTPPSQNSTGKRSAAVILLTYGEPAEPKFSEQFTYSLLILRRLTRLVAPIPRPLLPLLAFRRAAIRRKTWRRERYGSPLERISREQAGFLGRRLSDLVGRDWTVSVRVVFEFRPPLLPQVLEEMALGSPPSIVLLVPLYVADSDFTSGVSRRDLEAYKKRRGDFPSPVKYVSAFSEDDRLVQLMARYVLEKAAEAGWSDADRRAAGLILGAHGTVLKAPAGIDTGLRPTKSLYERLAARLSPHFAHTSVGWLNHALGGEWTSPDLETAALQMRDRAVRRVLYFPFGFLADNAESELEGRMIFRAVPELQVLHLPCLNVWPPFLEYLASKIADCLNQQ